MGRFWLGFGILVLLLGVGIFIHFCADNTQTAIADDLDSAAALALNNDADAAFDLAQKAMTDWNKNWHNTASFADHAPMDEIDSLFAGLAVYQKTNALADFAAYCARISMLVRAIGESQTITWWNLL